jgi:hypothetical protein
MLDEILTIVQRTLDKNQTKIRRKSNENPTNIEQKLNGNQRRRHDGRHYKTPVTSTTITNATLQFATLFDNDGGCKAATCNSA